jgi:hypothetical protein
MAREKRVATVSVFLLTVGFSQGQLPTVNRKED